MATLTDTAIKVRKLIRYSIYGLILLIIARIVIEIGGIVYKKVVPPKPPTPTVSFGTLPKIPYPTKTSSINLTFTLETPDGALPNLPTLEKVFFMPKKSSNLLSLDNAKQKARALGFSNSPIPVSPTVMRFAHPKAPATLVFNIVTEVFSISYDFKADPSALLNRSPTVESATSLAKGLLSGAGMFPGDLTGPTTNEFLKFEGSDLVPALSLSDAKLIKINFYRKDYDKLPVLAAKGDQANVWFLITGANEREKQIIAAEYYYYSVDETKFATYPIKTAQQAWDDLTAGNSYVLDIGQNNEGDEVKIRRIYLGYYDPNVEAQFLQPIVVFEGDRGFKAYVTAITAKYYGE